MDLLWGSEVPTLDVLIVGAGLSGLTSAIKILAKEKTLNMKIIDENGQPGGQLACSEAGEGEGVTKFVNEGQDQMIRLMDILHVQTRKRMCYSDKLERCWDLDRGATAHPAKFELDRYLTMLDLRMKDFSPGRVSLKGEVPTMKRHIEGRLFFNKSRLFMFNLVELTCGINASEVNFDEFMSLCSTCGGVRTLIDLYFNVPNTLFEVSSKALLNGIMERIKYTEMLFNRKVVLVRHYKNYVEVVDSLGDTYTAETVILAIPWNKVEKISFNPQIPKEFRHQPHGRISSRRMVTTFVAQYHNSWWGLKGFSGSFLYSKPLIVGHEFRPMIYTGLTIHAPGEESHLRDLVLGKLAKYFGNDMLEPHSYQQFTFEMSEALSYPQTTPWHRVIWSSSAAVGTYYRNHLGGAVQSGLRAAINAMFLVRPQVVTWRDLLDLQNQQPSRSERPGWFKLFLSKFNVYNVTFYGLFVTGLVFLLDRSYKGHAIA